MAVKDKTAHKLMEISELSLAFVDGFKWIARNEIGSVTLFKKKPARRREVINDLGSGYDSWVIEGNFPIHNHDEYKETEYGEYSSLTWDDSPIEIMSYLDELDPMVAHTLAHRM